MFNFFQRKEYLDYKDVLILPRRSNVPSRQSVHLTSLSAFENNHYFIFGTPIIVSNMDTTGTFEVAKVCILREIFTALHKHYTADEIIEFMNETTAASILCFVTVGANPSADIAKLKQIDARMNSPLKLVHIDIANGYIPAAAQMVAAVRETFPNVIIMVGNIATPDGVKPLAEAGANIIKVGIGPGGQCRTRETAGVGVPQITAIQDCAKAAKKYKVKICADGGIQEYADFAKAFAAGADIVMAGSIFAAHDESGGEIVYDKDDIPFKEVYGMASETAMNKYNNGVAEYRASEGRTSLVPLRGPLDATLSKILGCLRSTCSYTNSFSLDQLKKNAKLITVRETINRKYEQYTTGH